MNIREKTIVEIGAAVREGLTARQKFLPGWLLYDERGIRLFQEIITLPEYYLTRCETEILVTFSDALAHNFKAISREWDIVELGAGDGSTAAILLRGFNKRGINVHYHPIDPSRAALQILKQQFADIQQKFEMTLHHADLFSGLKLFHTKSERPRLTLMMGGTIGNHEIQEAGLLLRSISSMLQHNDRLLVGFDLMKAPSVIEKAYDDYTGITSVFNKNLLARINRELSANFSEREFEHWSLYDVISGTCRNYLVSLKDQSVYIGGLKMNVHFKNWETIQTGISQKYNEEMIFELAALANLTVERMLYDDRRYFTLVFLRGKAN